MTTSTGAKKTLITRCEFISTEIEIEIYSSVTENNKS